MAELEAAAEHERILREIESTETACIGPTLRSVYDGEEHGHFMEKLELRIKNHDREIEKMCNFHYQGFVDSITELLKVRGEAEKLKNQVTDTNRRLQHEGAELLSSMKDLQQCRIQQRNIATTVDKLNMCLPVLEMYSKLQVQMKSKRHYPALKTLEQLEHTFLPQVSHYRFCQLMVDNIPKLREEIKDVSMSDLKDFLESIRKHSERIGETAMKQFPVADKVLAGPSGGHNRISPPQFGWRDLFGDLDELYEWADLVGIEYSGSGVDMSGGSAKVEEIIMSKQRPGMVFSNRASLEAALSSLVQISKHVLRIYVILIKTEGSGVNWQGLRNKIHARRRGANHCQTAEGGHMRSPYSGCSMQRKFGQAEGFGRILLKKANSWPNPEPIPGFGASLICDVEPQGLAEDAGICSPQQQKDWALDVLAIIEGNFFPLSPVTRINKSGLLHGDPFKVPSSGRCSCRKQSSALHEMRRSFA
ncbi:hypothetical protein XELAEV_18004866mg [Xenopus laevis]|uniref:Exocyst complex component EXOC6/Sec15 N-terminal domain-containing protein n=1 Tax=Xenopus laevis TaxID=8355 RepID=A0A974DVV4_XENLA|nr:hypothetical protein XELAEV_18004866mg [Xenopus laevis]